MTPGASLTRALKLSMPHFCVRRVTRRGPPPAASSRSVSESLSSSSSAASRLEAASKVSQLICFGV
jgi:hypothetical protein